MTTATDTFRQHLQETQAIHFLPYVGDGYADARPRILMIGEANHGTAPDGADRTYTDGVVRRALQDAAEGNGNHWVRYIRNISAMLTGNAYGGSNAVWDTVAYGVFFQHMETETHRNRSRATPEEIALGRGAFFAMLDVLKPDFVIVWGLTLFKQHWLSPESGITMLAPGLCAYVFTDRPDVRIWHCHHRRGISAMFPNTRNGRPSGNCISADTPPGLIQVSLTRPDAASRMGPGLVSPEALGL